MKTTDFRFHFSQGETRGARAMAPRVWTRAFWRGRWRMFALVVADGWIRCADLSEPRLENEAGQWNFAVAHTTPQNTRLETPSSPDGIRAAFHWAVEEGAVARLFCSESNDFLVLHPHGRGELRSPGNTATPFRFEIGNDFFGRPLSFWQSEIRRWHSQESDFAFAHRWHFAPDHDERRWMLTRLERGTREELESVGRLLLRLNDARLAQARAYGHDEVRVSVAVVPEIQVEWRLIWNNDEALATPQEIALWRVLAGWFAPRLDVDEARQHECARVWSNPRFAGIALSAPCDEPSAHERLEARLQLRDWLGERAGLTDERIAELLA
jgi:hypothetical protein